MRNCGDGQLLQTYIDGVGLAAAHVQVVVADAQGQDALVDTQAAREENKVLSGMVNHQAAVSEEWAGRTGAFLSTGLMVNFLSLNEMLRISDHGKPIFGVSLHTCEVVVA